MTHEEAGYYMVGEKIVVFETEASTAAHDGAVRQLRLRCNQSSDPFVQAASIGLTAGRSRSLITSGR